MVYLTNPSAGQGAKQSQIRVGNFSWASVRKIFLILVMGVVGGCLPPAMPEPPPAPPPTKSATRLLLHPFQEIGEPKDLDKARDRIQSFLVGRSQERFGLNYLETGPTEADPRTQSGMERMTALGITHLLTGRMKPPPNGFFLVELYEPPRTEPILVRDVPVDNGKSLEAVVDMVMSELEERFKKDHVTVLLGKKPEQTGMASAPASLIPGSERTPVSQSADKNTAKKGSLNSRRSDINQEPGEHPEKSGLAGKSSSGGSATKSPQDAQTAGKGSGLALVSARNVTRQSQGKTSAEEREEQSQAQGQYQFAIQVAAAPAVKDFEKTADRIRQKGWKTQVQSTRNRKGKQWYFLWVGRYLNREKAADALAGFRKKFRDIPAFITPID
ncbi:MAG: SPOR domain-containing protein [Magnetococcales bacterium]|nr:SPOR domain-containing protein [Magnetococcales bacterium]